jgi:hypothetical protein
MHAIECIKKYREVRQLFEIAQLSDGSSNLR